MAGLRSVTFPRESAVGHLAGVVLTVSGLGMLAAAAVDTIDRGPHADELALCALGSLVVGLVLRQATALPRRLSISSVFGSILASWVVVSLASTAPYLATGTFTSFGDALFESVSGFTTTGATVLQPIEGTSAGVLFWRSTTQWLGGMGVLVLAAAVLPVLGVGGLGLLAGESPAPAGSRLDPRVRQTAARLWILYGVLTVLVALGYWVGGMSLFDAVNHSFTTASTGGFSTHDASFAYFDSALLEWIALGGMLLAGVNFALYWQALRGRPRHLFGSTPFRTYLGVIATISVFALVSNRVELGWSADSIREELFTVVSLVTTTGYGLLDYAQWAQPIQVILLAAMAVGGMAGSTAGGLKTIRLVAITSFARRELLRSLHSRLVRPVRVGRDAVEEDVASRIVGFTVLFLGIILAGTIAIAASGAGVITSLSAATSAIGNVGPGLGDVGPTETYNTLDPGARMIAALVMLLGRLEIFPVLLGLAGVLRWRRTARSAPVAPITGLAPVDALHRAQTTEDDA